MEEEEEAAPRRRSIGAAGQRSEKREGRWARDVEVDRIKLAREVDI